MLEIFQTREKIPISFKSYGLIRSNSFSVNVLKIMATETKYLMVKFVE